VNQLEALDAIRTAFADSQYPGDDYLLGSLEGSEPGQEIKPFIGQTDWKIITADVLDAHAGSLNFFSEAGLRFFLPAYLVADLNGQLQHADPVFILVHGFSNLSVPHEIQGRVFVRKTGKDAYINPKRYGALTFEDYARFRLSVFSRQEAGAIVKYLEFTREKNQDAVQHDQINAALNSFWYTRMESAPGSQDLADHLREEEEYLEALFKDQ
jgi:hypothetical protein